MLETIQTKSQADRLYAETEEALRKIYRIGKLSFSDTLQEEAREQGVSLKNQNEARNFFMEIQKTLSGLPILELTIAINPSPSFITKMSNWVKKEIGNNVILDINVATCVLGGAIISYQGHYLDLSLKKKTEEYFEENKTRLLNC